MVHTIHYARENKIPFFGICLGMQCATIEYARDVAELKQADSTEFDPQTPHRVIYKLRELLGVDEEMGGTMRLGAWPCKTEPGSFAAQRHSKTEISERHRHRHEFNRDYEKILTGAGLRITGRTPDENYVEIVEAPDHPWFSAASSIRNSSPSRSNRIRSSPPSSVPPSSIKKTKIGP